jgi:acyl-CoA hydrolase
VKSARWPRALDLRRFVSPGDTVAWSHAGAEPRSLVSQLVTQRQSFGGRITVFLTGVSFSDALKPEHADIIRFVSVGGFGTHSRLAEAGCLEVIPCRFSDLPDLIASHRVGVDVAMFSGSVPDADGLVSLGPTMAINHELLAAARVSLLEMNPNVPYVLGDTLVDVAQFDAVIVSDVPLVTAPRAKTRMSAAAKALCENVASLIPDGSTLQVGLGSVGQALPRFLGARKDIGLHSSIMTDELADLVESGVINGSAKERDHGIAVTGELLGTEHLYRFAHRNPKLMLRSTSYLLSEEVLAGFRALVSVNGALQVDLTGQVNAESRGGVHVGAVGGALDFIRAAARSTDGASIIALQSTTSDHQSRIVGSLDNGVVSTPRSEVEFVVTEHGVADLRGRAIPERAEALTAIAHPDHRRMLCAAVPLS